ncbi:hypothetical protein VNO80_26051 [Phaseolus coccineus]|uniref:Uncharacterized protein n=1 Tax=Phaseolus coccineus TaxID=3886 RepID=A0AAN9M0L5_PHACN
MLGNSDISVSYSITGVGTNIRLPILDFVMLLCMQLEEWSRELNFAVHILELRIQTRLHDCSQKCDLCAIFKRPLYKAQAERILCRKQLVSDAGN